MDSLSLSLSLLPLLIGCLSSVRPPVQPRPSHCCSGGRGRRAEGGGGESEDDTIFFLFGADCLLSLLRTVVAGLLLLHHPHLSRVPSVHWAEEEGEAPAKKGSEDGDGDGGDGDDDEEERRDSRAGSSSSSSSSSLSPPPPTCVCVCLTEARVGECRPSDRGTDRRRPDTSAADPKWRRQRTSTVGIGTRRSLSKKSSSSLSTESRSCQGGKNVSSTTHSLRHQS